MKRLEIIGIDGLGEVESGNSVGGLIYRFFSRAGINIMYGDILVIAQKIVSKSEGRTVQLNEINPSPRALELSRELDKDPALLEIILRESRRIIRKGQGTIIVETHHGFICANAGVDLSNVGYGKAVLLPIDPDRSAQGIREEIRQLSGVSPGVIISDSFGRPWRLGTTDVAIGVEGLCPLVDYRGMIDNYGYELKGSMTALADEIASAAALVMGKSDGVPVVLVRGIQVESKKGAGRDLLRPETEDLFRKFDHGK